MHHNMSSTSLIYVADPMCSWCYAFAPELDRIVSETGLEVRLVLGGLYTGDRVVPLDDTMRGYLADTWKRIAVASGQPVSYDLLAWQGWSYDTEPACRAVAAVRHLSSSDTLAFFDVVQRAFYEHNQDTTQIDVLAQLAEEFDIPRSEFLWELDQQDIVQSDVVEAKTLGARGFPHLVLDTGSEHIPVSVGYRRAAPVIRNIRTLI